MKSKYLFSCAPYATKQFESFFFYFTCYYIQSPEDGTVLPSRRNLLMFVLNGSEGSGIKNLHVLPVISRGTKGMLNIFYCL